MHDIYIAHASKHIHIKLIKKIHQVVVAHASNSSIQEAEAGQSGLQSKFQDSQSCYTEKPVLEPAPSHPAKKRRVITLC